MSCRTRWDPSCYTARFEGPYEADGVLCENASFTRASTFDSFASKQISSKGQETFASLYGTCRASCRPNDHTFVHLVVK